MRAKSTAAKELLPRRCASREIQLKETKNAMITGKTTISGASTLNSGAGRWNDALDVSQVKISFIAVELMELFSWLPFSVSA